MTSAGDLVARARAGKRLEYPRGGVDKPTAERMLEAQTQFLLEARERNAGLARLDLDAALERLEHRWLPHRGVLLHTEVHHVAGDSPTVVVVPGLGDHTRRHLGLAAALAERGYNSVLLDRQGHGLSEGIRGDSPLEADLGALEGAIAFARRHFDGPVIALGDSLGGILVWYSLTREPDIDAAVCHCIGHPEVHHDPSFRFKAPVMRALGRVAPLARIPVRRIADYEQVALDPVTLRHFSDEADPLFNFTVTARSAASYIGFRPAVPWELVRTPALVAIGSADRMVTPEYTRRSLERGRPARADYLEIEGAGHQLFLDDIGVAIGPIAGWADAVLGRGADGALAPQPELETS